MLLLALEPYENLHCIVNISFFFILFLKSTFAFFFGVQDPPFNHKLLPSHPLIETLVIQVYDLVFVLNVLWGVIREILEIRVCNQLVSVFIILIDEVFPSWIEAQSICELSEILIITISPLTTLCSISSGFLVLFARSMRLQNWSWCSILIVVGGISRRNAKFFLFFKLLHQLSLLVF